MSFKDFPGKVAGMPEHNKEVDQFIHDKIEAARHAEQMKAMSKANRLSAEANRLSKEANKISKQSNKRATIAIIISASTFVLSVVSLVLSITM